MTDRAIVQLLSRFAAFGAAFYGAWIWYFHSFNGPSAFAAYGDAPEAALALPLIIGGLLWVAGEYFRRRWLAFVGPLFCVTIFLAAEVSCYRSTLSSTGVPAYFIIGGVYLILAAGAASARKSSGTKT